MPRQTPTCGAPTYRLSWVARTARQNRRFNTAMDRAQIGIMLFGSGYLALFLIEAAMR